MKTYTKPSMMVLSISANDPLCLGCANGTRNDPYLSAALTDSFGDYDGNPKFFSEIDAVGAGIFDAGEEGTGCRVPSDYYCKMNSAVNIFTS